MGLRYIPDESPASTGFCCALSLLCRDLLTL